MFDVSKFFRLFFVLLLVGAQDALAITGPEYFESAKKYTVKVRNRVGVPLYGDEKGVFEGAGFLVDKSRGWIVTNAHVVGRSPSDLFVGFWKSQYVNAKKLYVDPFLDLAVIEVKPADIPVQSQEAVMDCRQKVPIGQPIGAFGHPLGSYFSGTTGVVSGEISNMRAIRGAYLQIDAAINPGNSGGPLIDMEKGQVIGINTASRGAAQNTNFALKVSQACKIVDLLRQGIDPLPPSLNVAFVDQQEESRHLLVAKVYKGKAFQPGDEILAVGNESVETVADLVHVLRGQSGKVRFAVLRGGKKSKVIAPVERTQSPLDIKAIYANGVVFEEENRRDFKLLNSGKTFVAVTHVDSGSIGDLLKVSEGDIVEAVDGESMGSVDKLRDILFKANASGQSIRFQIKRLEPEQDRVFTYHFIDFVPAKPLWIREKVNP
ncbi:MAG: trypsin-like peptidase domain-containing protein [Pseudobdellovibrionaceae bacterium]|nr:trypsin-like peptidase domain-containing protein [Bdellovibrionales bacterium]USN47868.1 MAG: trypsin-like peptidase domain-containing protein [Pseudobdellovibrionaceae bacterium]